MMKKIFSLALVLSLILSAIPGAAVFAAEEDVAYLFAYFTGNNPDQESMHYGISTDGYNFKKINGGNAVYTNPTGTGCLRDPFIFEGEDGYFYALATDMRSSAGWASNRSIITMKSANLIDWETNLIPVTELFGSMSAADRVWAPQAIYDPEKNSYMIYLAIRTQDATENGPKTVMYRCWTDDFKTITEPELFFAPADGSSAIDGDIIYSDKDNKYYMYYKNEDTKFLFTATADSLGGVFTETGVQLPSNNSTGVEVGVEGPAIYKLIGQDKYNIIYDAYGDGFFVMSETTDHQSFTQLSQSSYSFDFTPRHGYVIPINQREYNTLIKEYGADQQIRLNPAESSPFNNGEFEGWGTSMGWWGNRIGYDETLSNKAAELLYSEDGLGLDIVRYNVGGGDDPTHDHITRSDSKLPCFMNEDGTYDWNADYNQVNVLKKIKSENQDVHIEGYTNSPPWFMTESGCSSGGVDAAENLAVENYPQFVSFLADVTEHFEEIGLKFDSYSPMNEPNPATKYWGALSPKQEGNHVAQGAHQSQLILALDSEYNERGIDTLIAGPDETSIDYTINAYNAMSSEAKSALDRLDTHTYSGSKRTQLKELSENAGKNLWMSEVDGSFTAGSDNYMKAGLGLSRRIIDDINGMQPSAWVMWDIIDCHKDANFPGEENTRISQTGGIWGVAMADHDTKDIVLTKKYYAYGQFTKFIKPHMTIVASSNDSVAAYDKNTGEIVVVAINTDSTDKMTEIDLRDFAVVGDTARMIRTSGDLNGENWAELAPVGVVDKELFAPLKANSITTFVIENGSGSINKFETTANAAKYQCTVTDSLKNADTYFAVYDENGVMKAVRKNQLRGTIDGNFENCTAKLFVWNDMTAAADVVDEISIDDVDYLSISGSTNIVTGVEYPYSAAVGPVETGAEISWAVSDESVASVTADGVLTALKGGTVTLTATAVSLGISSSIDITVLDASGYVAIKNKKSGLVIDTASRGVAPNTSLMQWAYESYDTSNWQLSPLDDGYFNIINRNNNLAMANVNGSVVITDAVDLSDNNAKWQMINHSGYYEIKNVGLGKSLNVSGQSVANGGNVILYAFGNGDNELWTLEPITGDVTHVEPPEEKDYSSMYEGTGFTFVKNIEDGTNDFSVDKGKFAVSGFSGTGLAPNGDPVMYIQNTIRSANASRISSVDAVLDQPLTCEDDEYIDISFDLYCPHSNGVSEFSLTSSSGVKIADLAVTNWGGTYALSIGGTTVEAAGDASTYFKNNTERVESTYITANGAHMTVRIKPSTGEVTVIIKNNTNTAAAKTYTGTVPVGTDVSAYHYGANYTSYSRYMLLDELITNIIR